MLRFGWKYNMCQTFIMFSLCTSLAGQNQTKKTDQAPTEHSLTNASTTSNNDTTSPKKTWISLNFEDLQKIAIVTMFVSAMSGLLNLFVIVAIVMDPLKILRKGPWVIIFNLATADLISSVSFFCFWGESFFTAISQKKLFFPIVNFSWAFGASSSFLWLTMFTVQVFVITKAPLKGRYWFTTKMKVVSGIVIWLCAFLLGLTNMAWYFFPELPLVSLKLYIGQIAVLQIAVFVQIILNIQVAITITRAGGSVGNVENNKHQNIAKTVIILTLILFLTAFPYFLLKQMELLERLGYFGQSEIAIFEGLAYCYTPIATLNFLANPILYSLRLPDYRKTLLVFVGRGSTRSYLKKSPMHISLTKQTKTSIARSQKASTTLM